MSAQQEKFKAIADKLREKLGITDLIKPNDFVNKIDKVYGAGKEVGKEVGKEEEYNKFWTKYLETSNHYYCRFSGLGWNDYTYNPPDQTQICCQGEKNSFAGSRIFYFSRISDTKIPIRFQTKDVSYEKVFAYNTSLKTIRELDLTDYTGTFDQWFADCTNLTTIETITGTIKNNGFDVSPCTKLTPDSLKKIIEALADKTTDTGTQWVITLGTDNLEKLSNTEKAIATQKGWDLA